MCPPPQLKSKPLFYLAILAGFLAASLFIPGLWPEAAPSRQPGSIHPAVPVSQPSQSSR